MRGHALHADGMLGRALVAALLARGEAVPARRVVLYGFATCLSVPLLLVTVSGLELPLSFLAIVCSVPFYLLVPAIPEKRALTASFALAVAAGLWTLAINDRGSAARFVFSIGYFFLPYLAFFPGYALVRRHADLVRVVSLMSWIFAAVGMMITASLLVARLPVRVTLIGQMGEYVGPGAALAGSVAGLPLYATWGVISLAVFYATMFVMVGVRLRSLPPRNPLSILFLAAGGACLLYLVVGSQSRTVLTGLVIFAAALGWDLLRHGRSRRWVLAVAVPLGLALAVAVVVLAPGVARSNWSAIAARNVELLRAAQLDAFTSGRMILVTAAIEDLADRPLTGSGFQGFREGILDKYNSSPHNQYLTAAWKMGLPAAAFYFLFLYLCVRNLVRLKRAAGVGSIYEGLWALVLAYGLGFCLTWDVFLVPLTGAFVMFLFGAVARVARAESASVAAAGRAPAAAL